MCENLVLRQKKNLVLANAFLTNSFVLYPPEVSEDYFQRRFPRENVGEISGFFDGDSPSHFLDR